MNKLHYGDNLTFMRGMLKHSVDLIYLDPPFNSKRNYNLMYKNMTGKPVPEQVEAFCDTWELDAEKHQRAKEMPILMREHGIEEYYVQFWRLWMQALRNTRPGLLAYLVYMVERLMHMRITLKPGGSIYLHCDPTVSHYIKVMMDGIFGHSNFRNEVIWHYAKWSNVANCYQRNHDTILYYSKGEPSVFNVQRRVSKDMAKKLEIGYQVNRPNDTKQLIVYNREKAKDKIDEGDYDRIVYRDAVPPGAPLHDTWDDINIINSQAKERLGYPTQKPQKLLDRIIQSSSNPGDVIFDPFCGCGTTIYSAETNGRKWIGCDIAILAVRLVRDTLKSRHKLTEGTNFTIDGIPVSTEQAVDLFNRDPFQFQHWVVERVGGFPMQKKVADRGIDGRLYFDEHRTYKSMVLSVKGGHIQPRDIRDLRGVLERESDALMAGFISLKEPTKAMKLEASQAGMVSYGGHNYPRLQMLTVAEILEQKQSFRAPGLMTSKADNKQGVLELTEPSP